MTYDDAAYNTVLYLVNRTAFISFNIHSFIVIDMVTISAVNGKMILHRQIIFDGFSHPEDGWSG